MGSAPLVLPLLLLLTCAGAAWAEDFTISFGSCSVKFFGKTYHNATYSTDNFTLCFGERPSTGWGDCILGPQIPDMKMIVESRVQSDVSNIPVVLAKPTVSDLSRYPDYPRVCSVLYAAGPQVSIFFITFEDGNTYVEYYIYNTTLTGDFGYTTEGGDIIKRSPITPDTKRSNYFSVIGCDTGTSRLSVGQNVTNPNTCEITSCALNGPSTLGCSKTGTCSETTCVPKTNVCVVTGDPHFIKFDGERIQSQDRCSYNVLAINSSVTDAGFKVVTIPGSHRSINESFVDKVHVDLKVGVNQASVVLGQGRKVWVNGTKVNVSTTVEVASGVFVTSSDRMVVVRLSMYNTTLQYNGYTLAIQKVGGRPLDGVCSHGASSGDPAKWKNSNYGSTSCAANITTDIMRANCTETVNQLCGVMANSSGPFAACHSSTPPGPYVEACVFDLCRHGPVDHTLCSSIEAYAMACLLSDGQLDEWRTQANCPSRDPCLDMDCADHEFCGERNGESVCLCRRSYLDSVKERGPFDPLTSCSGSSASLSLDRCRLVEADFDYKTLHLNDPSCIGVLEKGIVVYRFDYNNHSCGTLLTYNNTHIIYKNSVQRNHNSSMAIHRMDETNLDFSCAYTKNTFQSMALGIKVKDSSVSKNLSSGEWNYKLTMTAFYDAEFNQPLNHSAAVQLDQRLYLSLNTTGLDSKIVMVTDACWATPESSSNAAVRWDIIKEGCANPADSTVNILTNGDASATRFSFNMFKFSGKSSDVFLHCSIHLCVLKNGNCAPTCSGVKKRRRRRSLQQCNNSFITMAMSAIN